MSVPGGFSLASLAALLDPSGLQELLSAINAAAKVLSRDHRIVVTIDVQVDPEEDA